MSSWRSKRDTDWSQEELEILEKNQDKKTKDLICLLPNRSEAAIKNKRTQLGLGRTANTERRKWLGSDYLFIKENKHLTDSAIAVALGVSASSVKCARLRMNVDKKYQCDVCGCELKSQGNYCKEHGVVGRQLRQYKSRAATKGLEFTLTDNQVYELLISNCSYCDGAGGGIDRIDSSEGYIQENAVPCCWRCNAMKNDMSLTEWFDRMRKILSKEVMYG